MSSYFPEVRSSALVGILFALAGCSDSSSGPANTAPVAVVRPVASAARGDTVLLDGTASSDADGDSLTFSWTMLSSPAGSSAEVLPPDGVSPAFVADLVGSYQVSLVASDGHKESSPDQTTITVTLPAPRVTIGSPTDDAIVTSSPVTVTGSVTDADAVTVNGVAATVDALAGTFAAVVPLTPGSNAITAEAVNVTGLDSTAIVVILNTANTPVVIIGTPKKNFLVGRAYLDTQVPQPETVQVLGVIRVFTDEPVNTPTVTVHGVAATIGDTTFSGCPAGLPKHCFKFTATLSLPRADYTLWAVGQDPLNGLDSASVYGTSDYAFRPSNQQWTEENKTVNPVDWTSFPSLYSLRQPTANVQTQNVRAQEIDGCSAPTGEAHRNDPMSGATQNRAPTAFGAGTQPPSEYLVFGQTSAQALPCNKHDICYQTVGSSRATCDNTFYAELRSVCSKAYPTQTTGYLLLHPIYKNEQSKCYSKAATYYDAVRLFGQARFDKRQAQHSYVP